MTNKRLINVRMSKSPLESGGEVWILQLNPIFVVMEVQRENLDKVDVLFETESKMNEALVTYMGELINDFYREGIPIKSEGPTIIRTIPRDTVQSDVKGYRPP